MTTQEINFAIICGALVLICLFAVGLMIYEKNQQKKSAQWEFLFILLLRPSLLHRIQTWLDQRRHPGHGVLSWLGDQCLLLYLRIR